MNKLYLYKYIPIRLLLACSFNQKKDPCISQWKAKEVGSKNFERSIKKDGNWLYRFLDNVEMTSGVWNKGGKEMLIEVQL